jgi:hypothetical protein
VTIRNCPPNSSQILGSSSRNAVASPSLEPMVLCPTQGQTDDEVCAARSAPKVCSDEPSAS